MWFMIAAAALSAKQQADAGTVSKLGYKAQAATRRVQGQQSVSAAKMTNMKLTRQYNDIQASNAVMGAASGRSFSSATVQNMMRADKERLNWDIEYSTLSGKIGKTGAEADVTGYTSAGQQAQATGFQKGLLSLGQSYAQYKQVG